jgi:lysophospholipid acyltransferase 7
MNKDDTVYITLIILSIPLGLLFKNSKSPKFKTIWSSVIGFIIALIVCYKDIIHSLFIVTLNSLLIQFMHPKYLPIFSFITTFSYLLFFRTTEYFGLPKPVPYANAIQLILTLKVLSVYNS